MIESVGLKLLTVFKEPLAKISKSFKDEFLQIFNNSLSEYLDNYFEKYSKTKTFIFRDERVDFYDIFFPVTVESSRGGIINTLINLNVLFDEKQFITIIGSAGSGKSMLMKHLFLSAVKKTNRIPIVLELRNLNDFEGTFLEYVANTLMSKNIATADKFVDRILNAGTFLFLFDGYDEIYSSSIGKITTQLEDFVDKYNKNTFVITSRPGSNAEILQRFDNYYVQDLDKEQIVSFVKLQLAENDDDSVDRILKIINRPENKDFEEYLSNPLLLSMFIFTFNTYPEIPKYKSKFYWNVFETLCTKHDALSKNGFWLHERRSGLENDDFENILKWLSYITLFKGKYNFEPTFLRKILLEITAKIGVSANVDEIIYDLTVSIAILIEDGTEYTFPHKSLQEYFAASLIKGLNEVQKEKVYVEKLASLQKHSGGGNINFYKLCHELDKASFSKFFLIPNAKKYLALIDSSNDSNLTKTSIRYFGINLIVSKSSQKNYYYGGYSFIKDIDDSFLSFFTKRDHLPEDPTVIHELLPKFSNWLDKIIPSTNEDGVIDFKKNWNQQYFKFCNSTTITSNFKAIYEDVKVNLERIENEIIVDDGNTSDLLNI